MLKSILCGAAAVVLLFGHAAALSADTLAYASAQNGTAQNSTFGVLDLTTGGYSQIATLNVFVNDLVLGPDGTLYALTATFGRNGILSYSTIDPETGAVTNIAPNTDELNSMAFDSDGTLYATSYTGSASEALYSVDPATGTPTFIADLSSPLSSEANQLRFIGDTAYTTTYATPSGLYSINLTTGVGTLIGNTGLLADNGLGANVGGQLVDDSQTATGGQIFLIDPETGNATAGPTTNTVYVFAAENAPEPTSAALAGLGLMALMWASRRRIRQRLFAARRSGRHRGNRGRQLCSPWRFI
jgi:outer membrane protein assembly factor BamB